MFGCFVHFPPRLQSDYRCKAGIITFRWDFTQNSGNYDFDIYLSEKNNINSQENSAQLSSKHSENQVDIINYGGNYFNDLFKNILSKVKNVRYFFLTSPINAKLKVSHQNLLFSVFFRFNGYKWKIDKIILPL